MPSLPFLVMLIARIVSDLPKRTLSIRCDLRCSWAGLSRLADAAYMNANLQAVEVVVPVYNEERALRPNLTLLLDYLREEFPFSFGVVIADNASTDATWDIARELEAEHP